MPDAPAPPANGGTNGHADLARRLSLEAPSVRVVDTDPTHNKRE